MHSPAHDLDVADRAALWPQTIRILIVIDGRIDTTKDPQWFGLGYLLETLRTPHAWWVRFEVGVRTRNGAALHVHVSRPSTSTTGTSSGCSATCPTMKTAPTAP